LNRLPLLAFVLLCSSCATLRETDTEPAWAEKLSSASHTLGALTKEECADRNGVWAGSEDAQIAICQKRITDGGSPCTDHDECQGFCVTETDVEYGARATGICTRDYYHSDCVQGVSRGRAEPIVCRCG
jgi:hypothetical protein